MGNVRIDRSSIELLVSTCFCVGQVKRAVNAALFTEIARSRHSARKVMARVRFIED